MGQFPHKNVNFSTRHISVVKQQIPWLGSKFRRKRWSILNSFSDLW